ncbi:MAG TPA: extracellular solute-binding protein [Aggregatilineales bacterium]|nr:extracellular solute-binding protein [Aggregatilineales bacterium]
MRKLFGFFSLLLAVVMALPLSAVNAAPKSQALPKVDLVMWHQEGADTMKGLGIQKVFDDWAAKNAPGSTLKLVAKDTEVLRTDFQAAALAGSGAPDLLWTVADQAGPFTAAGLIQPVDSLVDLKQFLPAIVAIPVIKGKTYGIPLQAGNHLMLLFNKKFVPTAPATWADLIKIAHDLATKNAGVTNFTPLAWNQGESFWVFPVAHGYGATEFAADGKTPVLDTDGWTQTYQFFSDLKFKEQITPKECDYNCMDGGFQNGTAAMILNGDWSLGGDKGYIKVLGDNLGISPWPKLTLPADSKLSGIPAPFIAGKFLMFPTTTTGDHLKVAQAFADFLTTDKATVLSFTVPNGRLPALTTALQDDSVAKDKVLSQTAAALQTGVGQPVQPEMRCVFDAVTAEIKGIMAQTEKPADAPKNAQKSATACISTLNGGGTPAAS